MGHSTPDEVPQELKRWKEPHTSPCALVNRVQHTAGASHTTCFYSACALGPPRTSSANLLSRH